MSLHTHLPQAGKLKDTHGHQVSKQCPAPIIPSFPCRNSSSTDHSTHHCGERQWVHVETTANQPGSCWGQARQASSFLVYMECTLTTTKKNQQPTSAKRVEQPGMTFLDTATALPLGLTLELCFIPGSCSPLLPPHGHLCA